MPDTSPADPPALRLAMAIARVRAMCMVLYVAADHPLPEGPAARRRDKRLGAPELGHRRTPAAASALRASS